MEILSQEFEHISLSLHVCVTNHEGDNGLAQTWQLFVQKYSSQKYSSRDPRDVTMGKFSDEMNRKIKLTSVPQMVSRDATNHVIFG